jgi:UDP-N-acetyl-2-amino-2-deoxyglucuronate dehydrogenase
MLGCGFIARAHLRGYLRFPSQARIVALCDRSPENASATAAFVREYCADEAKRLTDCLSESDAALLPELSARIASLQQQAQQEMMIYSDWGDLARDPRVDLASNTTPPFLHHASTLGLLQAGKHVLLEKPMVGSLRDADDLIRAADDQKLVLSVVSQGRFADDQRRLRAVVAQGKLGNVFLVKSDTHWYRSNDYYKLWWRGNWSNECGGVLLNHVWHMLDQALFILGKPVVRVMAQMGAFVHTPLHEKAVGGVPTDDTILAILTFADGSLGEVTGGVTMHAQRAQLELFGERAAATLTPFAIESQDTAYAEQLRNWAAGVVEPVPADWTPPAGDRDTIDGVRQYRDPTYTHTTQVKDFLDAIVEHRAPLITGRDARQTLEVVLAAYKSAITGQSVSLPLPAEDPYYSGVYAALTAGGAN